ncbi:MAG: hypothetical protein L3J71_16735 [Victivallaceae bacterium]|nr:hypothetical protein [Victivallaceae bacterium]
MHKKIKKWAKITAWGFGGLVILLIAGYFVAANYYLPRYFQENIIPELVEEAGIRGFSGKVTSVGAFGADLGEMVIGPADNPTLKADKVTLAYSLQKSWNRGYLIIDQVVFSGVNLKCAVRNGQLVINGIDREKILAELQDNFVKPKNGKLLSIQAIVVRKGLMELELYGEKLLIPFELLLTPQDSGWNKLKAELKIELDERTVSIALNGDFKQGKIEAEFNGKISLRKFVELYKLIEPETVPVKGIYEGENSFKGTIALRFKPKLSITEFNISGTLDNGRIDAGDLSIRNITLRSGHKKQLSYSIIRNNGKFNINISDCRLQRPIVAEIKNFTGEFTLAEQLPVTFAGRIKLPLDTLPFWRIFGVKPLYGITFDSQLDGSYNRQTKKWQFTAMPRDKNKKDAVSEWFFKYIDNYVFTTVKHLSITGKGQGGQGEINIKLDIPKANLSGRQRMASLRGFRLDEKLRITTSKLMDINVKHVEGRLSVENFSGRWDGNSWNSVGINLNGHADITQNLQLNHGNFSLDLQALSIEKKNRAFVGDLIKTAGDVNFSLDNSTVLLNSLNGKLAAAKINTRYGKLRSELKNIKLQQLIEFSQGLIVKTVKSKLSADKLTLFAGDSTITWWKTVIAANMPKRYGNSIYQVLNADMTFGKASCEMVDGNRSVASGGSINFSLPITANSLNGKIAVKAEIPRFWYFANSFKGRATGLQLESELMLNETAELLQLTAVDGSLSMDEAEISDADYYLKFKNPRLKHNLLFEPDTGYHKFAGLKLALVSPKLQGGYKESIVNLAALDWMIDYKRDRNPLLTTILRGRKFSAKSFITGSCNVPEFELKARWDGYNTAGKLKFNNASGNLLKPVITGSGISAEIPLGWPALPEKQSGKLSAKNISYNGLTASKLELVLDSTPEELIFKGNFTNNISSEAGNFCFGKLVLPPAKFYIDADLSLPAYKTVSPINLGRFIPEWDGVTFAGTLQGKANISYNIDGLKYRTKLKLSDSTLASDNFTIKQLTTTWTADNFSSGIAHEQDAEFAALEYDRFVLKNGKVKYRIDAAEGIKVGRNTFQWLGSEAFIRPFTLKNNGSVDNLEIYCRKLPTTEIMGFLGIKQVECNTTLQGVIQAKLNNHELTISSAKLNSIPDRPVTIKIGGLDKIIRPRRGSEKDFACDMLQAGFRYNWLKLGFSMLPTVTTVSIRADGQPVGSPPFIYNYDDGTFSRCEPGKGNISGEISLFTEIRLKGVK